MLVLALAFSLAAWLPPSVTVQTELKPDQTVEVRLVLPSDQKVVSAEIYRSTSNLRLTPLFLDRFPISRRVLTPAELADRRVQAWPAAAGVEYTFLARVVLASGQTLSSPIGSLTIPDRILGPLTQPRILISKSDYCLSVFDQGKLKKIYPIAMGLSPDTQKLFQDNASTPEGAYRIIGRRPKATYYKALDLDYPNEVDRVRYQVARKNQVVPLRHGEVARIGGSIQIHGLGILNNWTWGCVALRNDDIDELFEKPSIHPGVRVFISGASLNATDVESLRTGYALEEIKTIQNQLRQKAYNLSSTHGELDERTRTALGQFQVDHHLPLTCEPDARTRVRLQQP